MQLLFQTNLKSQKKKFYLKKSSKVFIFVDMKKKAQTKTSISSVCDNPLGLRPKAWATFLKNAEQLRHNLKLRQEQKEKRWKK